jgi:uncharacterized membrane protein
MQASELTFTGSDERIFRLGMYWRIGYGVLRILLAIIFLKVVNVPFNDVFRQIFGYELLEDPNDPLVSAISLFLDTHPITITYFATAYLLFWGTVDIVLSSLLLRHYLWAFPVSLALIGPFVLYEVYRFIHTYSLMLLTMIVIDVMVFWLIWREYKQVRERLAEESTAVSKVVSIDE